MAATIRREYTASLATAHIATCLSREHACRTSQLGEAEIPRLRELLDAGGAPLE